MTTTNHNGVTPRPVSYDEALALLEQAERLEAVVENHGHSGANTFPVRRALQASKRILFAAQVSATLAVADELRQVREAIAANAPQPLEAVVSAEVLDRDVLREALLSVLGPTSRRTL